MSKEPLQLRVIVCSLLLFISGIFYLYYIVSEEVQQEQKPINTTTPHVSEKVQQEQKPINTTTPLVSEEMKKPVLDVVYFTGINPRRPNWKELITAQMQELVDVGLYEAAHSITLAFSSSSNLPFDDKAEKRVDEAIRAAHPVLSRKTHIVRTSGNQYEYPGIRTMKEIADRGIQNVDPRNHFILYFHAKGMFNGDTHILRTSDNLALSNAVIVRWRENVEIFYKYPHINKVGFASAPGGWIWYNFYWIRASYAKTLARVMLNKDRYYYEAYAGCIDTKAPPEPEKNNNCAYRNCDDCFSVCPGNKKKELNFLLEPSNISLCFH